MRHISPAEKLYQQYFAFSIQAELGSQLSDAAGVFLPGSKEFEESDLRFTKFDRPTYIAAVRPFTESDVAITVKYAHTRGIPCMARGGAHGTASSMKAFQNGIVIDMRHLKQLSFCGEKDVVTLGGGVQSDDLIKFLHGHKREITVGSCPTTGVIGLALGAGVGRLQGKYGYMLDSVISYRVVLADGSIVCASETEHKDLFWALRGAGHNFGIVVEAQLRVYPQEHDGIHYNWDFEYTVSQGRKVFETMNSLADMEPDLAITVLCMPAGASGTKNIILVNVVWSGAREEAEPYVALFAALSPIVPTTEVVAEWPELPWITYQKAQALLLGNTEAWRTDPKRILSSVSLKNWDVEVLQVVFQSIKDSREQGLFIPGIVLEAFPQQRPSEIPENSTAFPWRNGSNIYVLMQVMVFKPEQEEAACKWLDHWTSRMIEVSGYGRLHQYVNYGRSAKLKVTASPTEALYGYDDWRLEKLRRLKHEYDPQNWWRWYQPLI